MKRSHSSPSLPSTEAILVKRSRQNNKKSEFPRRASATTADAVHADPPLPRLLKALRGAVKHTKKQGDSVVYWMRMGDLRIHDNRALSRASAQARKDNIPLVVIFVLSPQDYIAHDRSPRRIDFTLRNLALLKTSLSALHIPLYTTVHSPRLLVPSHVLSLLESFGATQIFANIEYELDELRRDIKLCALAKEKDIKVELFHDRCIVEPGVVKTGQGKTYTVYSPYLRSWLAIVNTTLSHYLEICPPPLPNSPAVRQSKIFGPLFDNPIPEELTGFELSDSSGDKERMRDVWPAGEDVAKQILNRFLTTKARTTKMSSANPLAPGAEDSTSKSRIRVYDQERDKTDRDSTSRLSPYLSAGVISARECVRSLMKLLGATKVDAGKTGVGRWVQELAWRDFYTEILAGFPRVCMGRPFNEKYAEVVWEPTGDPPPAPDNKQDSSNTAMNQPGSLQRWKDGQTGYPIVDAGMRCMNEMGWMHNRTRMICAMFLCKDLMIDWREGEKYFMQKLVDGDLASNNGGWQWSASTGTDASPYFRIFNPYNQSVKADPTGDFIRQFVPELAKLKGAELHHPPEKVADRLGYPRPIVKHDEARQRAVRRFKTPGES